MTAEFQIKPRIEEGSERESVSKLCLWMKLPREEPFGAGLPSAK